MYKKIAAIVFSLCVVLFLNSSVWGFGSEANYKDPDNKKLGQRDYTPANAALPIDQGGYYGGHDTIMNEAILLKKDVHNQSKDPADGPKFETFAKEALSSLRTGAHDEDSKNRKL